MKIVIQRVSEASVTIEKKVVASIKSGLLVLLGIINDDSQEDIEWLCRKIVGMRIFPDENGVMNKSIQDVSGDVIVVSQFTLHASTKKGNRPSFESCPELNRHVEPKHPTIDFWLCRSPHKR